MSGQTGLSTAHIHGSRQPNKTVLVSSRQRSPLRLALVGCGAISKQLHLPILAGHEGIKLAALVDRDTAQRGSSPRATALIRFSAMRADLHPENIDPRPSWRRLPSITPCTIALLRRGIHVLVEKPMATNYADAQAMRSRGGDRDGVVRGILSPADAEHAHVQGIARGSRWLGRPLRFEVGSGGFYNWAAATLGDMRKDMAGGGVLIDFGSHMLDLLHYLFEGPGEVLEYRDDALGGIESDCQELHLPVSSRR